jgi:hypothetical protein
MISSLVQRSDILLIIMLLDLMYWSFNFIYFVFLYSFEDSDEPGRCLKRQFLFRLGYDNYLNSYFRDIIMACCKNYTKKYKFNLWAERGIFKCQSGGTHSYQYA